MRLFPSHGSSDQLQCPYKGCEKHFDRPTMITDDSVIPRQTHYACPFCMSRLELETAKEKIVNVRAIEYPTVFDSPAKCAHFSGLLNAPPGSTLTQEECLICPKVLQCNARKKWAPAWLTINFERTSLAILTNTKSKIKTNCKAKSKKREKMVLLAGFLMVVF